MGMGAPAPSMREVEEAGCAHNRVEGPAELQAEEDVEVTVNEPCHRDGGGVGGGIGGGICGGKGMRHRYAPYVWTVGMRHRYAP